MRIALLEDDNDQAALLTAWLTAAGQDVSHYPSRDAFLRATHRESFDLYVLDWLLPDGSGIDVLKQVGQRPEARPPVLFVTVRDDERCIVRALSAGADDYMIKPVRRREFLARIEALARRSLRDSTALANTAPYRFDDGAQAVSLGDQLLELTAREFQLARFLFERAGHIVSRGHLLESIWGAGREAANTRTVDTHVSRLRKKLALGPENGWKLSSVYQHGYRLDRTGDDQQENLE